ncbi:MAG: hypothetical protein ACOCXT_00335 [Candidatus Dojkabacteria bacterium]
MDNNVTPQNAISNTGRNINPRELDLNNTSSAPAAGKQLDFSGISSIASLADTHSSHGAPAASQKDTKNVDGQEEQSTSNTMLILVLFLFLISLGVASYFAYLYFFG